MTVIEETVGDLAADVNALAVFGPSSSEHDRYVGAADESDLEAFVVGQENATGADEFIELPLEFGDVRDRTERLDALLSIDGQLHAPPKCRFVWGTLEFKAVMESANKRFTLFQQDGTPLRARADVSFKRYRTPEEQSKATPKLSADRRTVWEVTASDTLWLIADEEYGDPGQWRPIAEANDLSDPRSLEPGTTLVVPKLESDGR
jgi:LysM repeat protein